MKHVVVRYFLFFHHITLFDMCRLGVGLVLVVQVGCGLGLICVGWVRVRVRVSTCKLMLWVCVTSDVTPGGIPAEPNALLGCLGQNEPGFP